MFKRHVKGQNKPQRFTNSICFRVQFLLYLIKNRFGPKYSKTVWEKMMFSQRYLSSKVILIHNILSLVSDCSEIFFSFFQKIGWTMKKTLSTKISLHCTVPAWSGWNTSAFGPFYQGWEWACFLFKRTQRSCILFKRTQHSRILLRSL